MAKMAVTTLLLACYNAALARLGYHCLWKLPFKHGAGASVARTRSSGTLPDGTPMLRRYTGIAWLDRRLEPAVIFYHGLLFDRRDPARRLLLVQVHSGMQATALCMLALSCAHTSPYALIEPAFWGIFNQAYGAAFVYPLYLLRHAHSARAFPSPPPPSPALAIVAALGQAAPAIFLFPAFVRCSPSRAHRAIALYRFSPPALVLLFFMLDKMTSSSSLTQPALPLLIAGTAAALGHLYAVLGALRAGGARLLRRVFWPDNAIRAGSITDAAHLFLQYDVVVMAAAYLPYAFVLLGPVRGDPGSLIGGMGALRLSSLLVAAILTIGPGAVLAFALAARI